VFYRFIVVCLNVLHSYGGNKSIFLLIPYKLESTVLYGLCYSCLYTYDIIFNKKKMIPGAVSSPHVFYLYALYTRLNGLV